MTTLLPTVYIDTLASSLRRLGHPLDAQTVNELALATIERLRDDLGAAILRRLDPDTRAEVERLYALGDDDAAGRLVERSIPDFVHFVRDRIIATADAVASDTAVDLESVGR